MMKHWWQLVAVGIAGVLLGAAGTYLLAGGGERIAMVNMDKILTESKPGKEYQKKLEDREKALEAELQKIAGAQERAIKRDQFLGELTKLQKAYTEKVLEEADPAIAKVAKRHGIGAVFVRGTLRYAKIDLTDEVLAELGK